MDRFLLAENPMHPDHSGCFIIHMLDPIAIIGCHEHHIEHKRPHRHYSFINGDGVPEHWTLSVHHLFTTNMAALDDANSEAMIDKLFNRAWHWYRAYMQWGDGNIDHNELANEN